ncbi:17.9 kDa class II heat shock protein [Thalictrum thalictroides]|uniref:17.9 kDa class II heat shock protein n=2 Tax=Thalictrum thalictroides TaxID=46969 RepID=A0A7J6VPR7_THATH|nr:17.9 kDa class II heat shock protein [Thalictrum thalictroides]
MIPIVDENVNELFHFPQKLLFPARNHSFGETTQQGKGVSSIPVDILDTQKQYVFFFDVPGLSKADVQVTVEDERTLVIRSIGNGKRKREDGENEGCKYIRLERKASPKFLRKFLLPEDSNVSAVSAKCESGVLTITVEKLPPPAKPKTVEVTIS